MAQLCSKKETSALAVTEKFLRQASTPVVAWSSGKDSMALLHLARRVNPTVPVLFFFEALSAERLAFARRVAEAWDLRIFTYEPSARDVVAGGGEVEIVCRYDVTTDTYLYLPLGTMQNCSEDAACGKEILARPGFHFDYPWDVTLIGHRAEDVDPVQGQIPLQVTDAPLGSTHLVYPLHDWTTADVWAYHEQYDVPFNERRYDKASGYQEFADRTYNNDYYDICMRCLSPYEGETVRCPKQKQMIPNLAGQIDWEMKRKQWQFVNLEKSNA